MPSKYAREAFSHGMNACIETNGFHGARRYHLQMIYNPPGLLNTADFSHVFMRQCGGGGEGGGEERIVAPFALISTIARLIFARFRITFNFPVFIINFFLIKT